MGGADSLGGDWRGTPVANALPVVLDGTQSAERVPFMPTDAALQRSYALRLAPNPADNKTAWEKLNERPQLWMDGYTRLGTPKPGAEVLVRTSRGDPLLVQQIYSRGRTMALAVDT